MLTTPCCQILSVYLAPTGAGDCTSLAAETTTRMSRPFCGMQAVQLVDNTLFLIRPVCSISRSHLKLAVKQGGALVPRTTTQPPQATILHLIRSRMIDTLLTCIMPALHEAVAAVRSLLFAWIQYTASQSVSKARLYLISISSADLSNFEAGVRCFREFVPGCIPMQPESRGVLRHSLVEIHESLPTQAFNAQLRIRAFEAFAVRP
jgi:hypothetical protein